MLGCWIANYGVPGYGTDQAYLRFHDQTQNDSKIVFFGVLSENIQRNVNQFRNFLIPSSQCQTKPRFVLDGQGQLQLVHLPPLTKDNYEDFIKNPEHYLHDDYFVPGGPSGAQKLRFPYTWSIIKAYPFFYDRYVRGYKSYLQFYQPGHPSRAFPLTMVIIRQFVSEAKNMGKHPIVLVFPTDEDFRVYDQKFVYEPLIRELQKANIDHIDLGAKLLQRLGGRNYMELFLGGSITISMPQATGWWRRLFLTTCRPATTWQGRPNRPHSLPPEVRGRCPHPSPLYDTRGIPGRIYLL